ncbi:efflux RND transporter periplasmic adaptor subunit [Marinomonas sp.]
MKNDNRHWFKQSLLIIALLASHGAQADGPPAGGPPTAQSRSVGIIEVEQQSVPIIVELPGRSVAYEQANIRPRVEGVVIKKLYEPGKLVEKGTPLFQLDDSTYQASVATYEASVAEAEADLPVKQAAYDRAKKLEGSGYTSDDVDSAKSSLASAKATLKTAQAALKYARTQLSWTIITAPIQGIVDVSDVSLGDLVTAGQSDNLTTVTTLDPIYVDMVAPVAEVLKMRRNIEKGLVQEGKKLSASLQLSNGETYQGTGMLVSSSPTVSTSTGVVTARFQFDNPDHVILPGMFIQGTLQPGTQQAYLIPQRAGTHGADGKLSVFVVNGEGKAEIVKLDTLGSYNNNWIVTSGLTAHQQLIVDGQKNLVEGSDVDPVLVTIQQDGTTVDVDSADSSASAHSAQMTQLEK